MRWKHLLTGLALLMFITPAIAAAACDPGDPAQRGPEAARIAALKQSPAPTTWGYDLPYSYAYGAGVPFYVGHNDGSPSGTVYENPACYPYGVPEPNVIYGEPEHAMLMNYDYTVPFQGETYPEMAGPSYGSRFSPFSFVRI